MNINEATMELLTLILIIVLSFCLIFYGLIANAKRKEIKTAKRVLLVISHPDDECMFFGPTVLSMAKNPSVTLFVLCMSNGDHRKEGHTRKKELYNACQILGIPEQNITVLRYVNREGTSERCFFFVNLKTAKFLRKKMFCI